MVQDFFEGTKIYIYTVYKIKRKVDPIHQTYLDYLDLGTCSNGATTQSIVTCDQLTKKKKKNCYMERK